MVAAHAISQSRSPAVAGRGDTDRDRAALNAIARGEADLLLDPAELARWSERPEIRRVLDAAVWLEDRRRRVLAHRVIEQAMDHLSATLRAKTDFTLLTQRIEVRRAATALADLAITLLYGPPRSRTRVVAPTGHAAFPSFSAPRPPGVHSSPPTGPALARHDTRHDASQHQPVSAAPTPSRGLGVPVTRRDEPVPTPSTRPAHSAPAAPAPPAPHHSAASNPPIPLSNLQPTLQSIPQPTRLPALQPIVPAPTQSFPGRVAVPARRGGATSRSPAAPLPARLLAHAGAADTS